MTDRTQFEQMLEALISEDQQTAKDIFHNIVVAKSREIYEELLAEEFGKDDTDTPDADKGITDDADKDDSEDDFSDKDSTDDMVSDVDSDSDDSEDNSDEDVEDRVQDLEDALEDLKAEFEQLMAGEQGEEHMGGDDMGGEEHADDMGDEFGAEHDQAEMEGPMDMEGMDNGQTLNVKHTFAEDDERLIREYIEKVGTNWESYNGAEGGHVGAQSGSVTGSTNTKSIVASKNDMGGTASNIAQGHQEVKGDQGARSNVTGNGVMSTNVVPNPDAKGNINVPGGKAGKTAYKTQVKGGGIDRQSGFNKPSGNMAGASTGYKTDRDGEHNTKSPLNARK
jgi:hypothetical protein